MQPGMSRRTFLQVTGGISLATILASCGGALGSAANTNGNKITIWDISTGAAQTILNNATKTFNSQNKDITATIDYFENDPYKQKLQVAMGAHQPPDIFFGWGGGVLESYVNSNDVYDLTPDLNADASWKNRFLPAMWSAVTINNKIYGIPNGSVQPVVFLYNKDIFTKYNLQPPTTWNALLDIVSTVKKNNLIPIAVGGASQWPYLMYEEYLVDRLGGPSVFDAVIANDANAWSNPVFIQANTMIQDLVNAGAFGNNFASVNYDTGQAGALLYTGKAAMHLMGSWEFANVLSGSPSFISQNKLGWFTFPEVDGGKGDPANVAGNPSTFYSIASASKSTKNCVTYLKDVVLNDAEVKAFIQQGDVPAIQGIDAQLAAAPHGDWLQFVYNLTAKAPHYQLSWDQALAPQPAQALLTNLSQLFLRQITPQQFSTNMNKTITSK